MCLSNATCSATPWGVPIPCFYDKETRVPLMDEATIKHVTEIVRAKGTDAWWEMELVRSLGFWKT
jgi:isoleucyl-tRNA synthetase